ncbi:hypothetical protein PV325_009987 [Microctonus aethiopoides]|nr:hypothetical protein PV325_009987 [Microctonus aethiopoides]
MLQLEGQLSAPGARKSNDTSAGVPTGGTKGLNGYKTIIGFLTGKILNYATKNGKFRECDLGHKKEDHDCQLNFHGSAKAMEAAAGVELVNYSNILKKAGFQNVSSELYKMRDEYKELTKKNAVPHIKKCFAVSQKKSNSQHLAVNLKQISADHIFSRHENCGNWCKPNKKHTLNSSDEALYNELVP